MRSRIATWSVALVVLAVAGVLAAPLGERVRSELGGQIDGDLRGADIEAALGQGVSLALLGGFRTIAADFLWLKTNDAWERRDLPATQALIRVVQAVDVRALYFWINGARMVAYDMPYWRIEAAGGDERVPAAVRRRMDEEQAGLGLDMLERGLRYHPDEPRLLIEMANIRLNRLQDLEGAAGLYRRAAEQRNAPFFAARMYASLLERMDRDREAYEWLRRIHPALPAGSEEAMRGEVLRRIRLLEDRLQVPVALRYVAPEEEAASSRGAVRKGFRD